MPSCPRCQKPVDAQALVCPHCDNPLKAFGHPGMPLYQSSDGTSLCTRCTYHVDDTCNFPKRPNAKTCTLFNDIDSPAIESADIAPKQLGIRGLKYWLYRYRGTIAIALLILVSLVITAL